MTRDFAIVAARIEELIAALQSAPRTDAVNQAVELARETMALYGAGLARMLEIVRAHEGRDDPALVSRLAADPVVATVLALHDLLPAPVAPAAPAARPAGPPAASLVQIRRRPTPAHATTACETCGVALTEQHAHLVDVEERRLICSCDSCWTTAAGRTSGTVRAVPRQASARPPLQLSDPQWDALQIPVGLAFFVSNGRTGRVFAFYPSPAGAVESLLPLDAWRDLASLNPWLSSVAPDVEAVIARRTDASHNTFCSAVVPIDVCYDLIGRIRVSWSGVSGGDAVRREVDRFFDAYSRTGDPAAAGAVS